MADRVTVIGSGTWGTTLAVLMARRGLPVTLWCRTDQEAEQLDRARENSRYLPGFTLPPELTITSEMSRALDGCGILVLVVPSQTMRASLRLVRMHFGAGTVVLSATKGLEVETGLRMSEITAEELGIGFERIAALSGPNLAREIAAGLPATTVVASVDDGLAARLRELLMTPRLRVYTNRDVVGVELGGALKNVIALGAGICDGLAMGDNAKAAFISRGLLEISRLGIAAGAQPLTFAGLAGLGDVIATCASPQSRNRYVGEQIALGRPLDEVERGLGMVAEGVATTRAARLLARRYRVEMPIVEMTYAVLFEGLHPRQALVELMTRHPKDELAGVIDA